MAKPPTLLTDRLLAAVNEWSRGQRDIVGLAADFADSGEWALHHARSAAHWLAEAADVEACTAREWIRIGRLLRTLPAIAAAFADRELSYSKVRALTRLATPDNEAELLEVARNVTASGLAVALAQWLRRTLDPSELEAYQHQRRSVRWRTEPDGMVLFSLRLPPLLAGMLITLLTSIMMRSRATTRREKHASGDTWPTVAQQHADALEELISDGGGSQTTEVILHVRGDGCTLDDGTPIADSVVERLVPQSFLRVLIHDAESRPINASGRQRHPNTRQKRVVKERDRVCVDCGRTVLLEYDHDPTFEETGHTVVDELWVRCAPCHHKRHAA